MKNLCCDCKKEIVRKPGETSFSYKGLQVKIFGGVRCAECCKKIWVEEFKEHASGLIDFETGKINWRAFAKTLKEGPGEVARKMVDILKSIGVFSLEVKGNWEIIAIGSLGLNPKSHGLLEVYFTKEEDVVEFAYLVYGNTLYPWTIRHIDRIISKEEVSRKFEQKGE